MHGNIHTLKFQYTALETRKYDKLKTTETTRVIIYLMKSVSYSRPSFTQM
jgi:hypothetical protein